MRSHTNPVGGADAAVERSAGVSRQKAGSLGDETPDPLARGTPGVTGENGQGEMEVKGDDAVPRKEAPSFGTAE